MPSAPIDTATHTAGPVVKIYLRRIQRCSVCGEKLMDTNDPNLRAQWTEGQLVRAQDGFLHATDKYLLNLKKLPKDFCIGLVE